MKKDYTVEAKKRLEHVGSFHAGITRAVSLLSTQNTQKVAFLIARHEQNTLAW